MAEKGLTYRKLPSKALNLIHHQVLDTDLNRIIEMAWEDRTPFDAIAYQYGLKEEEVKFLMKKHLKFSSYKRWRTRVENCKTKHSKTRSEKIIKFKSTAQRVITGNRISKKKY